MTGIKLVEPSEICRIGISNLLTNQGLEVTSYDDIAELLELPSDSSVIIVGIRTDTFDEVRACLENRNKAGFKDCYVCVCSDEIFVEAEILKPLGVRGYCSRDVSAALLLLAIKAAKEGAYFFCPRLKYSEISQKSHGQSGKADLSELSPRELEVLLQLARGGSNQVIAKRLKISVETVKAHVKHILAKLSVDDRTQAALKAIEFGLIQIPTQNNQN